MAFIEKLLRTGSGKRLNRYRSTVNLINTWEKELELDSDSELRERITRMRDDIANGATLDSQLPECFAVVREASKRTLGMRHFDVQLIGGMAIHDGTIAEMKTGEGKTLTATLPVVLNALEGKGVHVVTVNDYLARRDAEWMSPIYDFLGISIGILQSGVDGEPKVAAYQADVTYGTNSEFGFDYLRDNLAWSAEEQVGRGQHFGIIDEVDNILIDEARTPLIISGAPEDENKLYQTFARVAKQMKPGKRPEGYNPRIHKDNVDEFDYEFDEKHHTVSITEQGVAKAEKLLGITHLYRADSSNLVNHLIQALKAQSLYHEGKDYAVINGEVKIVDEFTGRILEGRRWSEGLHQAVEAKEGLQVQAENQTVASITYQNFFRRYEKLAGMTGTAATEATELMKIYKLEVVEIPPNQPVQRQDREDFIYATKDGKWRAVANEVAERHRTGQPILIGTVSVVDSEELSAQLTKDGIKHAVLNAKPEHAEREGITIAQAGRKGAVTLATNMAGRGVDIKLGGDPEGLALDAVAGLSDDEREAAYEVELEKQRAVCTAEGDEVKALGGLAIIGTERHESRRIDNQLRGRAGRQGDPGESRFYLSAEDDLLRLFGGEWMKKTLLSLGSEDAAVEHKMLSKRVEAAQRRVEEQRYLERKHVIEYDDVMNEQRDAVYQWREKILREEDLQDAIGERIVGVVNRVIDTYTGEAYAEDWDYQGLLAGLQDVYETELTLEDLTPLQERYEIADVVTAEAHRIYAEREAVITPEHMRNFEQILLLQVLDDRWREHIHDMDYLRDSIHLRGFAQIEPIVAYKNEAAELYAQFVADVWDRFVSMIFRLELSVEGDDGQVLTTKKPTLILGDSAPQEEQPMNRQQRRALERQQRKAKNKARV